MPVLRYEPPARIALRTAIMRPSVGWLIFTLMTTHPAHSSSQPNRLSREKSPYLLQHAENPVDWYPWGDEAFAKARQDHKPVFLSIGYSTCHWCHVMERESFESPAIAELLNRDFVSIKVDREEHPDVDQLYMNAVTAMTGHGGWPLTVFLTPEGKPFFGGTYFPPERRSSLPGLNELLPAVAKAWQEQRDEIVASAEELTGTLRGHLAKTGQPAAVTPALLDQAYQQAANAFDPAHGGFGEAPKFPRAHELSFLLRYRARAGTTQALDLVTATLDAMSRGGLHDHLGGGFHRYSTDAHWLVPHFEKMLYDQALLARAYLEAYRVTRRAEYADVARGIFEYVLRDLTDSHGGFYAAEDADSEGEEGKFYVWTPEEIAAVLGPEDGAWFARAYGVTAEGNFSAEGGSASGGEGRSILHLAQPPEASPRAADMRRALLEARSRRVRPHRDDKVLTSWNGLMIASLAYGAATLDDPRYLQAAERAAGFILTHLVAAGPAAGGTSSPAGKVPARSRDGRLLRRYRDGDARYHGTLEDYAFFSHGLLELYQASGDPRWLSHAKRFAGDMVERFLDREQGGFFLRAADDEPLLVRAKEVYDGATPSGNSIAALVLLRVGRFTADQAMEAQGRRTVEVSVDAVARAPFAHPQMLIAADFALGPTQEIVIAGDPGDLRTRAMLRAIQERFLPRAVVVLHPPSGPMRQAIEALAPYAASQDPISDAPTAYVCENYLCNLPTTDVVKMIQLLERRSEPRQQEEGR